MKLALIAALSENRVIGRDGGLPWRLPADARFFQRLTTGRCVIMGRKTFESIGAPLPRRTSIVVTRDASWADELETAESSDGTRVVVVHDLDAAITAAEKLSSGDPDEEVFVAGGAEIYRLALPRAEVLYLTRVHADVEGDVFFPDHDPSAWVVAERVEHAADDRHPFAFTIETLRRRNP